MRGSSQPHRHSASDHAHGCIIQHNSRAAVALYRTILNASPPTQPAYGVPEKVTMSYLLHDKLRLLASQPRRTRFGIVLSKAPIIIYGNVVIQFAETILLNVPFVEPIL